MLVQDNEQYYEDDYYQQQHPMMGQDAQNNTNIYVDAGEAQLGDEGDYTQETVDQNTGDDEGESVYMIDGVVMRMIQIEGEDQQYLMDPQGKIYDMQANFIGTANTQGIEEFDQQQQQEAYGGETDEDPQFYNDEQQR